MSQETKHKHRHALTLAFWLNAVFAVIEIIGAYYTNSTAILTDAIHDLGDTLAIGLGVTFEKISERKPTKTYTYGYKRFSLLSALVLSLILIAGAAIMMVKAIGILFNPQYVNSEGMLWLAILGITVNGFAFLRIRQSGSEHNGHGHHNQNSKAIMLHFLEDVLGWIAVLIGSIVIYYTRWYWVDGLLSIGIAFFISFNAVRNLIETMRVFLQATPKHINLQQLTSDILNIQGIRSIHNLHVWALDENEIVCTAHVVIEKEQHARYLQREIDIAIRSHKISQSTFQYETD
jgi:cobalt-zinc-cadmium efflux system protein